MKFKNSSPILKSISLKLTKILTQMLGINRKRGPNKNGNQFLGKKREKLCHNHIPQIKSILTQIKLKWPLMKHSNGRGKLTEIWWIQMIHSWQITQLGCSKRELMCRGPLHAMQTTGTIQAEICTKICEECNEACPCSLTDLKSLKFLWIKTDFSTQRRIVIYRIVLLSQEWENWVPISNFMLIRPI